MWKQVKIETNDQQEKNEEMENVQYLAVMALCGATVATPVQSCMWMWSLSQEWWDCLQE